MSHIIEIRVKPKKRNQTVRLFHGERFDPCLIDIEIFSIRNEKLIEPISYDVFCFWIRRTRPFPVKYISCEDDGSADIEVATINDMNGLLKKRVGETLVLSGGVTVIIKFHEHHLDTRGVRLRFEAVTDQIVTRTPLTPLPPMS